LNPLWVGPAVFVSGAGASRRPVVLDADQQHATGTVGQAHDDLDQVAVVQGLASLALELDLEGFACGHPGAHPLLKRVAILAHRVLDIHSYEHLTMCLGLCPITIHIGLLAWLLQAAPVAVEASVMPSHEGPGGGFHGGTARRGVRAQVADSRLKVRNRV
jgi:hypothetical protein